MRKHELETVQRAALAPTRQPTENELAELLGLVRLLASEPCRDEKEIPCEQYMRHRPRTYTRGALCGPCHARLLLEELKVRL